MPKTILITGAGSGIGKGLSQELSKNGHRIVVTDVDLNSAKSVADEIIQDGSKAFGFKLDVTNQDSVEELKQSLISKDLSPDVLINNAGLQHVEAIENFPEEQWMLLQNVMLTGVFRCVKHFLPHMQQQNFGRIINIGSVHSLVGSPYKAAYVAAKHGLIGFSKVLALESAKYDITINTLCPGYVKTPLVEKQIASQAKVHNLSEQQVIEEIMLKPMPKKVFIEIDEVAQSIVFLISPAAKNITAQAIAIDGGWTAQ
jgi:3-hydroxybutyrate dehydrogenase